MKFIEVKTDWYTGETLSILNVAHILRATKDEGNKTEILLTDSHRVTVKEPYDSFMMRLGRIIDPISAERAGENITIIDTGIGEVVL